MNGDHHYRELLKKTVVHISLEPGMTVDDLTEDEAKAVIDAVTHPGDFHPNTAK